MRATQTRRTFLLRGSAAAAATALLSGTSTAAAQDSVTFAVIGDYGSGLPGERRVADLVHSWNPAFITTVGDNVYSSANTDPWVALNRKVGDYYRADIDSNRFYPSLGNHDWGHPGRPLLWPDGNGRLTGAWLNYFNLPGNGRYYDVRHGPVHLFVLDDYYLEPDGNHADSTQAHWLRDNAQASGAPWKIVVHHFPAYSSNGGKSRLRWPFQQWGVHAVMAGHHHVYERLRSGNTLFFVNGLGGASHYGLPAQHAPESRAHYSGNHGAMRVTASSNQIHYEFVSVDGAVRDSFIEAKNGAPPPPPQGNVPRTSISAPHQGAAVSGQLTVAGTATAPDGVDAVELVVKNTGTNRYWNEQSRTWQTNFHKIRVIPNNQNQPSVTWSYLMGLVPAGSYKARAWSRAASGKGDPFGDAQVTFTVR